MTTTLRMPDELEARYARLADQTGRSRTFYLRKALTGNLARLWSYRVGEYRIICAIDSGVDNNFIVTNIW